MARLSLLPKVALWLVALSALGVLFLRSAQSAREAPFAVERDGLTSWSLVVAPERDPFGAWLALTPPPRLAPPLGRQIFARAGESVRYPNPASMPLILRSEFDVAITGALEPDVITNLARTLGFEAPTFEPRCMARRRVSEPGSTRSVYFLVFDAPAFAEFRRSVLELLRGVREGVSAFDPAALSPDLMVAATNETFGQWLPLRDPTAAVDVDCLAPVEVR